MNENNTLTELIIWVVIVTVIISGLIGIFVASKFIKVWSREQDGKAELAEAEWSKRIAIEEAKALQESAVHKSQAEIERARGVAEANKIIAEGLKNNEEYLRYLWITNLNHEGQVIYVPTEAGLPILEAGKR